MKFIPLVIFVFLATSAHAYGSHLTLQEIERVKAFKGLLGGIDKKSLWETINELERSRHPQVDLEMKEAMAKAYTDIAREFNVEGQKKKEWLYSMVCLNMAYLQFAGKQGNSASTTDLNKLIRQKLKEYLPSDILNQPGFIYSLE
jgi:hypothetical protein